MIYYALEKDHHVDLYFISPNLNDLINHYIEFFFELYPEHVISTNIIQEEYGHKEIIFLLEFPNDTFEEQRTIVEFKLL